MDEKNVISSADEMGIFAIILLIGVSIRLIYIYQPFIDSWTWRQIDVAMIAENFFLHGYNIFYPQINWAGAAPGYVGTEFPLVPFLAALLYPLFGVQDWIGRAISILFFTVSVPFFYLLVKKIDNERSALLALAIYTLNPLCIFSSRSFMPDMASLSLGIVALYLFIEWLENPKPSRFINASLLTSLAILVKLTTIIFIGLPMLYLAWVKYHNRLFFRPKLWAFASLSLVFPVVWYLHGRYVASSNYPYHWFGYGCLNFVSLDTYLDLLKLIVVSEVTPIIFSAFIVGLFLPPSKEYGYIFHWWLIAFILYFIIVGEGNRLHQWYRLPLVPVAAFFAARTFEFISYSLMQLTKSKVKIISLGVLAFAMTSLLSYLYVTPFYNPWALPLLKAGVELNRIAPPEALILVADQGHPTAIYYSRRKGWHFPESPENFLLPPRDSNHAIRELQKRIGEGARYLVFTRYTKEWLNKYKELGQYVESHYKRIRDTEDYIILDLENSKSMSSGLQH